MKSPKKTKHAGGRPTLYTDEIINQTKEYLKSCEDEEYQVTKYDSEKSTGYETRLRVNLPSIEGLSLYLKVQRDTIYEWEKNYPEFSYILGELRAKQARVLLNNGLSGAYNPTIAKLLLSSKHGYIEKTESDVTTAGQPISINISETIARKNKLNDPDTRTK